MARQIPIGFGEVSIEHWLANYTRPAVCTFGITLRLGDGSPEDHLWNAWGAWANGYGTTMDSNVTLRSARLVYGMDASDPGVVELPVQVQGSRSGDSVAPALAVMVRKTTALGGRSNRGRNFLPWAAFDNEVSEQGVITTTAVNRIQASADRFLKQLEDGIPPGGGEGLPPTPMVLLHNETLGPVRPPTPVTKLIVNPVIRTQRRRQTRV